MVCGLFQGMAQQPLGVVTLVSRERKCGKTTYRRQVSRIFLQDASKNPLGCLPVVGHKGGRCFLNLRSPGVGEACALECNARVRILI